nr:hypothetical protein [Tanacetum cinerariifolium]
MKVHSPSSEIPNEEGVPTTSNDLLPSAGENVEQSAKVAEKEVSTADPTTTADLNRNKAAKSNIIITAATTVTTAEVAKNLKAQMQAELEEEERLARLKEEETDIALIES